MAYKVGVDNPWYPYAKVKEGYIDLSDLPDIPRKICDYLLDMPNGATGYEPIDDNKRPRTRFWKLLYFDESHPTANALPTPAQKMSVLFNPDKATEPPDDQKGYRLIPQIYVMQSQTVAQTRVHVYIGRMVPTDDYKVAYSVVFDIFSNYTYEGNTREQSMSRTLDIEAAIFEALNGVNMAGIGTFCCNKRIHPDCGSGVQHDSSNVVRRLVMAFVLSTVDRNAKNDENLILSDESGGFV